LGGRRIAKKLILAAALLALLALLPSVISLQPAKASPDWWDPAWSCRKAITVTELSGSLLNDYQVKIDISYEPAMRADFGDLRFINSGDNLLKYWVESKTDGVSATIWVEVDDIEASADTLVYMYYGNPAASDASDGDDTFEFFDDFEDGDISDWSQYGSGTVNIADDSGNYVLLKTANNDPHGGYCLFNNGSLSDFEAVFQTKRINETGGNQNRYGIEDGSFNGYGPRMADFNSLPSAFAIERRTGGGGGNIASKNTSAYQWNTWMTVKFRKYGSTLEFELYNSSGSMVESISVSNSLYNSFDRFVVHGGWEFYTDDIIVRKYVSPEPTCTIGPEACNSPPNPPSDLGPGEYVDGSWVDDNTPTLTFTQNDPDGNTVSYTIQIDDDDDFSSAAVVYTSELFAEGPASFTVGQAEGVGAYTEGYEGQTLDDDDYYWRVMSTDEHGIASGWMVANGGDIAFCLNTATEAGRTLKDEYRPTEDVTFHATGFSPGSDIDVYVVEDFAWNDSDSIPPVPSTVFAFNDFTANLDGEISGTIWYAPLQRGEYDIVFDAGQDGIYNEIPDLVDDPNHPGFTVLSTTVGGEVFPIDRATLLLPWLGLSIVLILTAGGLILIKRQAREHGGGK
jgi:hypothetical protein